MYCSQIDKMGSIKETTNEIVKVENRGEWVSIYSNQTHKEQSITRTNNPELKFDWSSVDRLDRNRRITWTQKGYKIQSLDQKKVQFQHWRSKFHSKLTKLWLITKFKNLIDLKQAKWKLRIRKLKNWYSIWLPTSLYLSSMEFATPFYNQIEVLLC